MNRQPIHSGFYQSSNYGNNLAYCYNCEEIIQVANVSNLLYVVYIKLY